MIRDMAGNQKPRKRSGIATHYAYVGGGDVMRKVTKLFNLSGVNVKRRRELIDQLIKRDGEVLAMLPDQFTVDCDMDSLERFLEGEL